MRISSIGLIAAVSLGLGGCAYSGVGVGVGSGYGYDDYGYGYNPYAYGGYSPYGYSPYAYNGYRSPGAWYNGYYYPGSGGWVYDRSGHRRGINRDEQAHFGRLGQVFRQRLRQQSGNSTTSVSNRTAVTTTSRVRAPAQTPQVERSSNGASRIVRVLRNRKDD